MDSTAYTHFRIHSESISPSQNTNASSGGGSLECSPIVDYDISDSPYLHHQHQQQHLQDSHLQQHHHQRLHHLLHHHSSEQLQQGNLEDISESHHHISQSGESRSLLNLSQQQRNKQHTTLGDMQHHYSLNSGGDQHQAGPSSSGAVQGMGQEMIDELVDQDDLPACAYAGVSGNGRMDMTHNSGNRQSTTGHHFGGMTGKKSKNSFVACHPTFSKQ